MGKLDYLARALRGVPDSASRACPNCGTTGSSLIERKAAVTALRRCDGCLLMFRTPVDDPAAAATFYDSDYAEGATTDMPAPTDLPRLKSGGWPAALNYDAYIAALNDLGAPQGARLFDFGCSWGYGSYQLRQAGFDVLSHEIGRTRARYGADHLGVQLVDEFEAWAEASPGTVDVFFSAHVLEHVPSPSKTIALGRRVLKRGGLFLAFFPNGSAAARAEQPAWSSLWGEVHPYFLDDVYFNAVVADRPRAFASHPRNFAIAAGFLAASGTPAAAYADDLRGYEMAAAFRV